MFPSGKAIKITAKASLKEIWPQAITIAIIVFLCVLIPQLIYQMAAAALNQNIAGSFERVYKCINGIFNLFVFYPLLLGMLRWFWVITAGEKAGLSLIFFYFSSKNDYSAALRTSWAFVWRIGVLNLIIYLPEALQYALGFVNISVLSDIFSTDIIVGFFTAVCYIVYAVLCATVLLRLMPLAATVINYRHHRISDNIREAGIISNGLCGNYINFILSMAGWLLLSLLAIPQLFTTPYFMACYAVLMRFSIHYRSAK